MNNMFSFCYSLISLDLSSFNTINVNNMSYMFKDCKSLNFLKQNLWKMLSSLHMNLQILEKFVYCQLQVQVFQFGNLMKKNEIYFKNLWKNIKINMLF